LLIIGTFEHSIELEQALAIIEDSGISRKHILVTLMDTNPENFSEFIGKSQDGYNKSIEVGMASGTVSSIIGISFGFASKWGPIFCALITAVIGFAIGFGAHLLINKDKHRCLPKKMPEITVIVQCSEDQAINIMKIMWSYRALTVGRTPNHTIKMLD
jgi:hypothetical protein